MYYIASIVELNGERGTTVTILVEETNDNINNRLDEIASKWFYCECDIIEDAYVFGDIIVSVLSHKEISKETFEELKGYLGYINSDGNVEF